jgi:hypothetical protein
MYKRVKKIRRDIMTFLAIDAQKNLFTIQKSQLQFEQSLVTNRTAIITKEMGRLQSQNSGNQDYDMASDPNYIILQREDAYLGTRKDSIDSQIALIDSAISGMKSLVQNNIKSSCSLQLLGG